MQNIVQRVLNKAKDAIKKRPEPVVHTKIRCKWVDAVSQTIDGLLVHWTDTMEQGHTRLVDHLDYQYWIEFNREFLCFWLDQTGEDTIDMSFEDHVAHLEIGYGYEAMKHFINETQYGC